MLPHDGYYARAPIPNEAWKERWPNFTPQELACSHCGEYVHNAKFMDKLQSLRYIIDKPFKINSGHRCAVHNKAVGGATKSKHLEIAVDISLHNQDRFDLANMADSFGFTGMGHAKSFLHLDLRSGPKTHWYYGDSKKYWVKPH